MGGEGGRRKGSIVSMEGMWSEGGEVIVREREAVMVGRRGDFEERTWGEGTRGTGERNA